jgi:hypothetical protein
MKGGETTLERVTRTSLPDIASEIDALEEQMRRDGIQIVKLMDELRICNEYLKKKSDALTRAANTLNVAEYVI